MGATLVTKDADFVTLRALRERGPAVVWVRTGNTRRRALLERFEAALPSILSALERGEKVVVLT
jgi:predicted nuclease of predicted toxin-antitoxin system